MKKVEKCICKHAPKFHGEYVGGVSGTRMYGKNTLVTNRFLAGCKAGEAIIYQHPDYTAYSKKALSNLLQSLKEEILQDLENDLKMAMVDSTDRVALVYWIRQRQSSLGDKE